MKGAAYNIPGVTAGFCCRTLYFLKGRLFIFMNSREYYINLLIKCFEKEHRLPKKSDFSPEDINRIKGFFGPWPHALEAAGLKEKKSK